MLEYLFNKVAGFKNCNVIKKRLQHRCFTVKFAKFLKTPFLQNNANGCFWTNPGDVCGSLCGEVMLWLFSKVLVIQYHVKLVKAMLRPIFCIDINTNSGRKWKITQNLFKEVWYNCSAHGSAHLFIIEISSHNHIKWKQPQKFFL